MATHPSGNKILALTLATLLSGVAQPASKAEVERILRQLQENGSRHKISESEGGGWQYSIEKENVTLGGKTYDHATMAYFRSPDSKEEALILTMFRKANDGLEFRLVTDGGDKPLDGKADYHIYKTMDFAEALKFIYGAASATTEDQAKKLLAPADSGAQKVYDDAVKSGLQK
ncbi:hypothetical protein J4227_02270 [Candidatus Woesearchaeota archaeon]|nr:hypothetical protein [Candidatus Woesearchaeota archaeon]